jgi:putative ABC transport system permease protein
MVVGVSAIILLVGLGLGVQDVVDQRFGPLTTKILVSKVTQAEAQGGVAPRELSDSDAVALADPAAAPAIASVTPVVTAAAVLATDSTYYRSSIVGAGPDYLTAANHRLRSGRMFSAGPGAERVVVLGSYAVATLFGGDSDAAIGHTVRVGRTPMTVIGTLAPNGTDDGIAYMPMKTARTYFGQSPDELGKIIVTAVSPAAVPRAVDQVDRILMQRHHVRSPAAKDYTTFAQQTLLDRINSINTAIDLFMLAAAGLSLLVGAVGIANVMLVVVTERTKEVGLRRAVGARRGDILRQFLMESTMLAGMGGVTGVLVGVGVTAAAAALLPAITPQFGTPRVSVEGALVAFGISLLVGVAAGVYPARRAARTHPIAALRFE